MLTDFQAEVLVKPRRLWNRVKFEIRLRVPRKGLADLRRAGDEQVERFLRSYPGMSFGAPSRDTSDAFDATNTDGIRLVVL